MKISCNYLEGKDAFANDGLQRPFIDPRVRCSTLQREVTHGSVPSRPLWMCALRHLSQPSSVCAATCKCVFLALAVLQGVLSVAHDNTKVPGSATACVMQLDAANKSLEAANLVRVVTRPTLFHSVSIVARQQRGRHQLSKSGTGDARVHTKVGCS